MMSPADFPNESRALCSACHRLGERGLCRATSGNFSSRIDKDHFLITQSGKEKSRLAPDDLMICDLDGCALDPHCRPSAETPIHARLNQHDGSIGAVLHTHSVPATILSLNNDSLQISGYEMQKALAGIDSHDTQISVAIFDNSQDMPALAGQVAASWNAGDPALPGFLIRGHGLYAWGRTLAEAERHIVGFEFLFECLWQQEQAKRK